MKKNNSFLNWKFRYIMFILLFTLLANAQTAPTPEGSPIGAAGKSGPPPPPPSPIDGFILPVVVLVPFLFLYLHNNRKQFLYKTKH